MPLLDTVSTAEFWVAKQGGSTATGGSAANNGKWTRYGTLQSVRISSNPNDSLEETFEGTVRSRGRGRTNITFESIIPLAGKRIDFVQLGMVDHASIRVVCVIADKKRTYDGIIDTDDESFGLNQTAKDSVKLMCGEPTFENIQ